jgi:alcohol dehydrogenase (cytochrome c)
MRRLSVALVAAALLAGACTSEGPDDSDAAPTPTPSDSAPWPHANLDISGTRFTTDSAIDATTVGGLAVAWTFEVPEGFGLAGSLATNPVIVDGVVWFADLSSNVYGVDLDDGNEVLRIQNESSTFGPNGVAVGSGRVYVAPDSQSVAAFDAATGDELWRNPITDVGGGAVNIQPVVVDDSVLVATSALAQPGSRGTLFALDAATGETRWSFDTIESPDLWGRPDLNAGGGAWFPPAVDLDARRVYWGTSNPYPWPGTAEFPDGSSRPGDNRWTNSTLALDLDSGELLWGHQHRPHDLFDLDAALTALGTVGGEQVVISSGKYGRVVGMDPETGEVRWDTPVGIHRNDELQSFDGPLTVYPGYVGGVTSPIAIADGVAFVGTVNAPTDLPASSFPFEPDAPNFSIANGQMVAVDATDGSIVWDVEVDGQPLGGATVVNDLVFGSTLTGEMFALDRATGEVRWSLVLDNGINGWPAVAGDTIVVPTGVQTGSAAPRLTAFRLAP